ncbi:hypothetical protein D1871_16005 [Nakamurella silvestris]|nr:hypothetical protein D1871_16005 [Nakamurella silvestris]
MVATMMVATAVPAMAGTSQLWHSGTIPGNFFYYTGYGIKSGESMFANPGDLVKVFMIDSANLSFYPVSGVEWVKKDFIAGTMKAACQNRGSTTITAHCYWGKP